MLQSETLDKFRLLGRGKYTDVFLEKGQSYVIKEARSKAVQALRHINNEYEKLNKLNDSKLAPRVYRLSEDEDGIPSLVMDYIPGKTLRSILDECEGLGKKMEGQEAMKIIGLLIAHVRRLHDQFKMAHFDLSPDNIMVGKGSIYFIDFSLAKFEGEFDTLKDPVGKVDYMAPEIYEREFGYFTDIYALGIIMEEIIKNSERHAAFDSLEFMIASMKIPSYMARAKIAEVDDAFQKLLPKKLPIRLYSKLIVFVLILLGMISAFFMTDSTEKSKRKAYSKKENHSRQYLAKKRKTNTKKPLNKKYAEKFKMGQETKKLFEKIIQ